MKMIIGGERIDSKDKQVIPVINPATLKQIDTVPAATEEDAEKALDFARKGFGEWSAVPLHKRIDVIRKFREIMEKGSEELAMMLTRELGKPISLTRGEAAVSLVLVDNFCESARSLGGETFAPNNFSHITNDLVMTVREPIGVIACILPFNYPIELFVQKVIPALLMGNAVVLKPASDTPMTDIRMAEMLLEAGVARNAIQVLTGSGAGIGNMITKSPKIDSVSLTGSTLVGKTIARNCSVNLIETSLELGGNDALIILDDCNMDDAVAEAIGGRGSNSGQTCCACKRFIVENSVKEKFTEKLITGVKAVKMGDPENTDTDMGPVVSEKAAKDIVEQIDKTVSQGAKIALGGKRNNAFVEPTILTDVTMDMDIATDMEVFGPVWPIIGVENVDEAIKAANSSIYGLSGGVITSDLERAIKVARHLKSGACVVNGSGAYRTPEQPFGGIKASGIRREGGVHTLIEMSHIKTIVLKKVYK